jgi:acetylornithine/N-succinyldiaminopimelate aminotransferase
VFFCNSGTEAIEGSIKFARKYARDHHGEGKFTVVAFDGSFHGRTMGAVAVTAREKYREPYMPVMPGVRFGTLNDVAALDELVGPDVCAVIIEPVQGEGGLRAASTEFLQRLRQLCDEHDALLVCDEIQCGMGRTGTLWAHEPYGITPDILTVAKPLGGGLPIGAILMTQKVADVIHPGDHGTTFGGGPLVTAVAGVVFNRISDPAFLAHVREVSSYFDEALGDLMAQRPDKILELRGRGLMRGLRINGSAAAVREAGHEVGLLVATAGEDVVRLLPPLVIETAEIDEVVSKLGKMLDA